MSWQCESCGVEGEALSNPFFLEVPDEDATLCSRCLEVV
jgi:hypothetical protein